MAKYDQIENSIKLDKNLNLEDTYEKVEMVRMNSRYYETLSDNEIIKLMHNGQPELYIEIQRRYGNAVKKWSLRFFKRVEIPVIDHEDIISMVDLNLRVMIWQIQPDSEYRIYTLLTNKLKYYFSGLFRHHYAEKRHSGNYVYELDAKELFQPIDKSSEHKYRTTFVESIIDSLDLSDLEKQVSECVIMQGMKANEAAEYLNVDVRAVSNAATRLKRKLFENFLNKDPRYIELLDK